MYIYVPPHSLSVGRRVVQLNKTVRQGYLELRDVVPCICAPAKHKFRDSVNFTLLMILRLCSRGTLSKPIYLHKVYLEIYRIVNRLQGIIVFAEHPCLVTVAL